MMTDSSGLYVHIPFCRKKCAYCDFVSFDGCAQRIPSYLSALRREAEKYRGESISTVFFGGGTPSLLSGEEMTGLLGFLRECFRIAPTAEITAEANPCTLTREKLEAYRHAGINRLSMGAQSLDDEVLRSLGRLHTAEEFRRAFAMARDAGFDNINFDLIFALPGQTAESWRHTLREACRLNAEHISCYSLTVEPETPLGKDVAAGRIQLPPEETERIMYHDTAEILCGNGIFQYEISNYARKGRECRHNLNYWKNGSYIGLGCAAHSFFRGARYSNTCSLEEYLSGVCTAERNELTVSEEQFEWLMLRLRLNEGLSEEEFRNRFGISPAEKWAQQISRHTALGLMERKDGFLRLKEKGRDFADGILTDYMD